jgi:hypothetical protein
MAGGRLAIDLQDSPAAYLELEHMAGSEACLLEPVAKPAGDGNFLAVAALRPDRPLLLVSAHHPDLAQPERATVSFRVPVRLLPAGWRAK